MEKVFYLLDDEVVVSLWENKRRVACYRFDFLDNGKEQLHNYLKSDSGNPVRVVVDIADEDFKVESLPKVYFNNRITLVNRYKKRLYPDSQFVYAEHLNPNATESKKSDYRFSAISNPLNILSLIGILNHYQIPIIGIWSAPILSNALLLVFKSKTKHSLLVVSPKEGFIRQSYFFDRQLVFSRLIHVEPDSEKPAWESITEEVQQTKKFLLNQRKIGFGDTLAINVIGGEGVCEDLRQNVDDELGENITALSIVDVASKLGIPNSDFDFCDSLLSFAICNKRVRGDHYSFGDIGHLHALRSMSNTLRFSSIALVVLAIFFGQHYLFQSYQLKRQTVEMEETLQAVHRLYESEFAESDQRLSQAKGIRSVVLAIEEIEKERKISPLGFYLELSKILSRPNFATIQLLDLQWQRESSFTRSEKPSGSNEPDYDDTTELSGLDTAEIGIDNVEAMPSQDSDTPNNPIQELIYLEGTVIGESSDAFYVKNIVEKFEQTIRSSFSLSMFEILRTPVDVRSEVQLEGSSESEYLAHDGRFIHQFNIER